MNQMKSTLKTVLAITIFLLVSFSSKSQDSNTVLTTLPKVTIKTLDNSAFNSADIKNGGKPVVLIFWKSCCSPNIKMLDAINEVYSEWKEETGVVVYVISIDDTRTMDKIGPMVDGKGWDFIVLLDGNSDFKRAMNVNATPHVFILNGSNEVIWQKTTYNPGDESEIYKVIKSIK
jgi:cytochrome c biogenesis protein CcmG, thiol:disulfide interchange protein DsbE